MELCKSEKTRKRCITLHQPVQVVEAAGIVGPKERSSHFAEGFDRICTDPFMGKKSWEEAESELQKQALQILLDKAGLREEEIDCVFSGDLLSQTTASSYGLLAYSIPNYSVYGACSNCGAALALGSLLLSGGYGKKIVAMTSSHFASAEKEFRFPLNYGAQRPLSATWTVTGCGAFLLSRDKENAKMQEQERHCHGEEMKVAENDEEREELQEYQWNGIAGGEVPTETEQKRYSTETKKNKVCITHVIMGEIVDAGLKDAQNMGACMAPAAALTIGSALRELPFSVEDYDQIITGDLGAVGSDALYDLLSYQGYDIKDRHSDCGLLVYDREKEDVHSGGSGCGCSAVMLAAYILRKLQEGSWKRVLFVPTGALLSKSRSEEGMTVPGIAHGVILESRIDEC